MTKPLLRMGAVLGAATIALAAFAGLTASAAGADVPIDHLVLSPDSTSITAGASQSYTAEAFDAENDDLGDVTADTTFSITPDGNCSGASCTATVAGSHTVTGTDGDATGSTSLTVNADVLDHLVVAPADAEIGAGVSQDYTAEGFDQFGNDLGDVTADTTFGIAPDGSCIGATCSATVSGVHTVTGTDGSATGNTSLTVDAGPLAGLTATATPSQSTPGTTVTITVEGSDQYGNDLGDKTSVSTITISAGGSCVQNECFSFTPGVYTITAKIGSVSTTTTFKAGAKQRISFPKPGRAHFSAGSIIVSPTATSGLPVTVTSSTPDVCTAGGDNGTTVTFVSAGTCILEADQAGNTVTQSAPEVTRKFKIV
jgi:hypothetical protein